MLGASETDPHVALLEVESGALTELCEDVALGPLPRIEEGGLSDRSERLARAAFEPPPPPRRRSVSSTNSAGSNDQDRLLPRQLVRLMSASRGLDRLAGVSIVPSPNSNPVLGRSTSQRAMDGPVAASQRVEDLVEQGHTRREALRQVTRESIEAEVLEGLEETLQEGTYPEIEYPGLMGICICLGFFSLVFVVAASLVCVCCCAMNFIGVVLTVVFIRCDNQTELRKWLAILQGGVLLEGLCVSMMNYFLRPRMSQLLAAADAYTRPGFTRSCMDFILITASTCWKMAWCLRVQSLAQAAPEQKDGCASFLPSFMLAYSRVLLIQVVLVQPLARLLMRLMSFLSLHGAISTRRGAKPGTLEALETVEFNPELFADPRDTADSRPAAECPICLVEYSTEMVIVKTTCGHIMHKDCLGRWLHTSHFCPICRGDLEQDDGREMEADGSDLSSRTVSDDDMDLEMARMALRSESQV